MQLEIENDRLYDVKKNLEEKDLLEQEVKISQVIAQLRLEEKEKMQEEIKQLKQIPDLELTEEDYEAKES